jgi:threonine dehydratase
MTKQNNQNTTKTDVTRFRSPKLDLNTYTVSEKTYTISQELVSEFIAIKEDAINSAYKKNEEQTSSPKPLIIDNSRVLELVNTYFNNGVQLKKTNKYSVEDTDLDHLVMNTRTAQEKRQKTAPILEARLDDNSTIAIHKDGTLVKTSYSFDNFDIVLPGTYESIIKQYI